MITTTLIRWFCAAVLPGQVPAVVAMVIFSVLGTAVSMPVWGVGRVHTRVVVDSFQTVNSWVG
jgi:hypothetical protein